MELNRVLPSIPQTLSTSSVGQIGKNQGADFAEFLKEAFANVVTTDASDKVTSLEALSATGGDLHNAVLATQKAELTLNLALQIRSKMIEAYQEVMRMQL